MLASNPTNRLHCQHSPTTCFESKQAAHQAHWRGSILDADPPAQGVKIARRMTVGLFVARGDASKRLNGTEEVFNEMAPLVLFRVVRGVSSGPFAQRNDGFDVAAGQALAQPVRIER